MSNVIDFPITPKNSSSPRDWITEKLDESLFGIAGNPRPQYGVKKVYTHDEDTELLMDVAEELLLLANTLLQNGFAIEAMNVHAMADRVLDFAEES